MARRLRTIVLGALPFLLLIAAWELRVSDAPSTARLLPSPGEVLRTWVGLLLDGTLLRLLGRSAINLLPSYVLGLTLAVCVGALTARSRTLRSMIDPLLAVLTPVPTLAWLPLIILFSGFTRTAIWVTITLATFTRSVHTTRGGFRAVPALWHRTARTYGYSGWETTLYVTLPAALPHLTTAARIAFLSAWRSLIGAEMLVASFGGIGTFLWSAHWQFNFAYVGAGIATISLIGLVADVAVFQPLERRVALLWGHTRPDDAR